MNRDIVFENLIDSNTGQTIVMPALSDDPVEAKTEALRLEYIAAIGRDAGKRFRKMFNDE